MARLLAVVPVYWYPLVQALRDAGHDVFWPSQKHDIGTPVLAQCEEAAASFEQAFNSAWQTSEFMLGRLDAEKAILAQGADPSVVFEFLPTRLTQSYGMRMMVTALAKEHLIDGVVTTCTYDPSGRAAAVAARETNVPLVHVEHACVGGGKEYSWYMREMPGDVICVPGERDAEWWKGTGAQIEITGHPLWDDYIGIEHTGAQRTVLWGVQASGGVNAVQTPLTWKYREHPDQVWTAFLEALQVCSEHIDQVIIKFRNSEAPEFVDRIATSIPRIEDVKIFLSTEYPQEVLPRVSLAVGLESNLQVEAMHLGIPCIAITQPGLSTFDMGDLVPRLPGGEYLSRMLAMLMPKMLTEHPPVRPNAWSALASRYNRAAEDGKGMERTVEVISRVVV